jgi:phosphoglycerate dehydrogenase-like enzyme
MTQTSIAILDDYQRVALSCADWSGLSARARVEVFHEPMTTEDELARALEPYEVIVLMRERTPFPASLIERLPRLRFIALTGTRTNTLDIAACTGRGILISHTTTNPSTATAELAIGLMLACARNLRQGFDNMARGKWQSGVAMGRPLAGQRLGVLGLGLLGREVARVGLALRMDVVAWSQNMTPEAAAAQGVRRVEKHELFATSDVVSLHLALSARTRQVVGKEDLAAMKQGAIFINTARAGLVDSAALLAALQAGRISAGLDVFETEPLPADHVLRSLPNVALTPHLGYVVADVFSYYYRDIVEDIEAWLAGKPIRLLNPDAAR